MPRVVMNEDVRHLDKDESMESLTKYFIAHEYTDGKHGKVYDLVNWWGVVAFRGVLDKEVSFV